MFRQSRLQTYLPSLFRIMALVDQSSNYSFFFLFLFFSFFARSKYPKNLFGARAEGGAPSLNQIVILENEPPANEYNLSKYLAVSM